MNSKQIHAWYAPEHFETMRLTYLYQDSFCTT